VCTGTTGAGFLAVKTTLAAVLQLVHPSPSAALALKVDTSRSHTGAVLQHMWGVGWQPLPFFSKKLALPQTSCSTFNQDLLTAYMFRHFRFLVEGQQFTLLTDQWLLLSGMCCLPSQYSSSSSCLL
jgi:hypothetical protein